MKTISHYTLNTGNMVESSVKDIEKEIYFQMKKIINRAKKEKIEFLDRTYVEIVEEPVGYVCTLYGKRRKEYVPILSTAGTKNPDGRFYIWNEMQKVAKAEFGEDYIEQIPIEVPYIVDLLHISAAYFPHVFTWTGGFAKCIGWMMLYPEEMRCVK